MLLIGYLLNFVRVLPYYIIAEADGDSSMQDRHQIFFPWKGY